LKGVLRRESESDWITDSQAGEMAKSLVKAPAKRIDFLTDAGFAVLEYKPPRPKARPRAMEP